MINGQQPVAKVTMLGDVSTAAWQAEKEWRARQGQQPYVQARAAVLLNATLIAGLIASSIYAPIAHTWLAWGICAMCAAALNRRGVNWQTAWREASRNLTGY